MARKGGVSKTKAFRKTDISVVEKNLDDARTEKQITGGVIAETSNENLFTVDKKGEMAKAGWTRQVKPLRLDEIVKPKSKIEVQAQKKLAKVDEGLVKKRVQVALKTLSKPAQPKKEVKKVVDPWAEEIPAPKANKALLKPISKAKAVRLPPAGASYNPEATSHEALMEAAAEQELARLERIEKVKAAVEVEPAPIPNNVNYDETTGMIFDDIFGSAESEEETIMHIEGDNSAGLDIAIQKRKSKAEKRSEAELEKAEKTKRDQKLSTIVDNQALHAKALLRKVKEEQRVLKKARLDRAKARTLRKSQMDGRKIGPMRFVRAPMEVKLPEEISGSLRELKPEGNLLEDRFKALQEQSKIEPRVRRTLKKRKYQLKSYEKHGYKNFV